MEDFLWMNFIVLFINGGFSLDEFYCNTYSPFDKKDAFQFSKSENVISKFSCELLQVSNRCACENVSCTKMDLSANRTIQSS